MTHPSPIALAIEPEDIMYDLAREARENTDGTDLAATVWLTQRILGDKELLDRVLPDAIRRYASTHVHYFNNHRRRERASAMPANVVPIDGSIFRSAVNDRYMSRPIWGGKTIGDSTAAEVAESANRFSLQAKTMAREAAWQAAVAKAAEANGPSELKVRDCLSEATLSKLWEEINGDTD